MKRLLSLITFILITLLSITSFSQSVDGDIQFVISMEKPSTHYYHVEMTCTKVKGDKLDVKLPAWTPGYYWLVNFAKNVVNFKVLNENGTSLSWSKTTKNTWSVKTNQSKTMVISYDVYAFKKSVADPYLDDEYAYLSPAGLFMYIDGQLRHPATVNVRPYLKWKTVSTGLEKVAGQPNTFYATDFDVLYDSPILAGNQETVSFTVQGVPHFIVLQEPEKFNIPKFTADMERIVETTVSMMKEMPYKQYTFLIMGDGRGGLEHLNSTAVFSSGTVYNNDDEAGYKRWLNFLTHEYFHLFNIKAIRPVALGPFDYDKENYTNMLWVSEGFTVYYEYIIMNRAGLLSKKECLEFLRDNLTSYENVPGHLFQSATESSFDTWIQFFNHHENTSNTTISYYDKGAVLGMMLDLKIRHETKNSKSLDDVMRTLYQIYFKEKKRGFTDEEFRQTCETIAGTSLSELFEYASSVKPIDYATYFGYAALAIDTQVKKGTGTNLGITLEEEDGVLKIGQITWDSPASRYGLSCDDIILTLQGLPVSRKNWSEILKTVTPGSSLKIQIERNGRKQEMSIPVEENQFRSFDITPLAKPTVLQQTISNQWLKD